MGTTGNEGAGMKAEEFEKFREGVQGVYSFYGKEVSSFALDVWWTALKQFDLAAVVDAFNRHLTNSDCGQWLPKPADIIRTLGGRTQDRALIAWSKVDKAVRSVGPYESVIFDDELIHRVISDMGGWIGFGQKDENEWPFVAKEFVERYRGYAMRGEAAEYAPVLVGIAEAYNARHGHKTELPVLVGNRERAIQVKNGGSTVPAIGLRRMCAGDEHKLALVK